ncbi:hypothetical protein C8R47DRAFT_603270 [Mycena vitilis]|nr:hypothetical protein C8R47DRAFT_603270 [Mycena vitilis]
MRSMLLLEDLTVCDRTLNNSQWFSLLEETFPGLLTLDIGPPFRYTITEAADTVASFLARHPRLKDVHVSPIPQMVSPSVRIHLPNLQIYHGPPNFIPMLSGCGLRETRFLWWDTNTDADIDRVIGALGTLTEANMPFCSLNESPTDRCTTILAAMSTHVPYTKTLLMHGWRGDSESLDSVTIDNITAHLPRLTSLAYLAIESSNQTFHSAEEENRSRATVEKWAHACPTLEGCWFNTGRYAWKKVENTWLRCSIKEFTALSLPVEFMTGW